MEKIEKRKIFYLLFCIGEIKIEIFNKNFRDKNMNEKNFNIKMMLNKIIINIYFSPYKKIIFSPGIGGYIYYNTQWKKMQILFYFFSAKIVIFLIKR